MSHLKLFALAAPLALALSLGSAQAQTTPAQQIAGYVAQSGQPAQAARGQEFFTTKHGKDWSCSSCHTAKPTVDGKHASTGKLIAPMAPAVNPQRFTDAAKTEKWFRRNCNDVVGRECSAGEKADVLSWLLSLKS
jgi:cytochrome c peroxidase